MANLTDRAMDRGNEVALIEAASEVIVFPAANSPRSEQLIGLLTHVGLPPTDTLDHIAGVQPSAPGASSTTVRIAGHDGPDGLTEVAESHPDAHLLLLYETAADYLGPLLAMGESLASHLGHWVESSQQLLVFLRRYRRRAVLVDYTAALRAPKAMAELCRQNGLPDTVSSNDAERDTEEWILERWLARQWLQERAETEMLEAELEASAHPLTGEVGSASFSVDKLVAAYLKGVRQSSKRAQDEIDDITKENELMLLQLHQVQEELEAVFLAKRDLENTVAEIRSQKEQTTGEIEGLRDEKKAVPNELEATRDRQDQLVAEKEELTGENELLLLQLHQVQEELEAYFLENQKLKAEGGDQSTSGRVPGSPERKSNELPVLLPPEPNQDRKRSSLWSWFIEHRKLRQDTKLITESDWFDGTWYLEINGDVAEAGMDPAVHYLCFGAAEGRNPSRRFDSKGYLALHDDVREAGMNPLVHYLRFGKDEGRALPPERSAW